MHGSLNHIVVLKLNGVSCGISHLFKSFIETELIKEGKFSMTPFGTHTLIGRLLYYILSQVQVARPRP